MRKLIRFAPLALFAGLLFLPHITHAASAGTVPFFGPIVPQELNACAAGYGMLLIVINNIIALAVTLLITFLAPLLIGWAGFLMVINPANPGDREKAKKMLLNVVVGILIVYSAYFIVSLVMGVLYNNSDMAKKAGKWSELLNDQGKGSTCIEQRGVSGADESDTVTLSPVDTSDGGATLSPTGPTATVAPLTEETFRKDFAAAGISVNKRQCDPYNMDYQLVSGGCTNVGQLRQGTKSQIMAFKQACDAQQGSSCDVTITGGSEQGHAEGTYSHESGFKVDLATTGTVTTFITSSGAFTRAAIDRKGDGAGPTYFDKCNNQYVNEGTHWDILIGGAGQSVQLPSSGASGAMCYGRI